MKWSVNEYLIAFNMINGIGGRRLDNLLATFKTLEQAWQSSYQDLLQVPGFGPKLAESFISQRRTVDPKKEIKWAKKYNASILTKSDIEYPEFLRQIPGSPPVIYYSGKLPKELGVAIVGSRKATYSGKQQAYEFARSIASCGIPIISGLARGIDTQAHLGAVSVKSGVTVAVLATPIDIVYPPENHSLADKIKTSGCLITEFSSRAAVKPGNFPRRNRLIAAFAKGVLVVEAGMKSGTLSTVDWALEQGKDVWAVPGEISQPLRKGTNNLIKQGAGLVDCAEDILQEFHHISSAKSEHKLDSTSALILSYYKKGLSPQEIVELTRLSIQEVQNCLTFLELEGLMNYVG